MTDTLPRIYDEAPDAPVERLLETQSPQRRVESKSEVQEACGDYDRLVPENCVIPLK